MKPTTEIQIFGTPSTKFTYIDHILKQVIERAGISVHYKQITDIKALLNLSIDAIPMVRINEKTFDFSNGVPTNEKLKELILRLLDHENFGNWPLISLITKDRSPNSSYLLSRKLSNSWNAVIDWYSFERKIASEAGNVPKERLDSLLRSGNKDWRGQLFSSPLTRYFNTGNEVPSFEKDNSLANSTLIIIDDQINFPSAFINQAVFDHQIPVITLNGTEQPISWNSILLFQDDECDSEHYTLLSLLNGKHPSSNDPALYITPLKINDPSFDNLLSCSLKRNEFADLEPAFAFYISNEQQLAKVLDNRSIPIRSHPNIFLPTGTSNNAKLSKFLDWDLSPNE